jgi:hypothetical protein
MNIKTVTTRSTNSGTVRGEGQKVSLDQALRAQTIDAAFILGREDEIGSIKVGKLADFVELSADPYTLDPMKLATDLGINGTWLSGSRIDLDAFLVGSGAEPAEDHNHLTVPRKRCC